MKKISVVLIALTIILIFSIPCFSLDSDEEYRSIYGTLGSSAEKLLNEAGISGICFDEIFNISAEKVFKAVFDVFKGKLPVPFKSLGKALIIIILLSLVGGFTQKYKNSSDFFGFVFTCFALMTVLVPFSECFACSVSVLKTLSDFMFAFIPVFTALVSSGGQPLTSYAYSGGMLMFAEFISGGLYYCGVPVISVITVLNVFGSSDGKISFNGLTSLLKRILTLFLSLSGMLFTGFVNIKTNLALNADSLALKGIKLVSGSIIPVIGSSVGDAVNSVLGSVSLVKNTLGVFAIFASVVIVLPETAELLIWYFCLSLISALGEMLGLSHIKNSFKALADCAVLLNVTLLFCVLVFILTTGNLIAVRG